MKGPMLWGAIVVSVIVLLLFCTVCLLLFWRELPPGSRDVALVVLGALAAKYSDVVAFWVGSSAGSMHKTALLQPDGKP